MFRGVADLRRGFRWVRFVALERVLLPVLIAPLRLLVRSWSLRPPDPAIIAELAAQRRLILVTCHGMLLQLLPFAPMAAAHGRRFVVMLSPSRDGRLLAALLTRFGVDHVWGTTGSRGVGGSVGFIARIAAGDVGIVAADGPRGPCCVVKPGCLRLAAAANARLAVAATAATRGLSFGSWDQAQLPAPFARVEVVVQLLPQTSQGNDAARQLVQETLIEIARRIGSPTLPRERAQRARSAS